MEHGGDLLSYEKYYDGELIDYSSNINPLGPPKGLEKVLIDGFKNIQSYPDIKYRRLKKSIANYLSCSENNTIIGNGAVELIDNFIILANRVLVSTPSFSEYEKRAIIHGKEVIRIPYNLDFTIDILTIGNKIQKGDLIILGNPNNPTGLRIDKIELIMLYNVINKSGAYLLLDEAFFEFCPIDYDSIELFRQTNYENLGIIRAATKFFALPGIRLGYGCTSIELVEKISKIELPWSINSFAEAAGNFIFSDKGYIEESKRYVEKERQYMHKELSKLSNIKVFLTETNYILIKLLKWDEEYVFNFFLKRGIVIRKCSSFIGLNHHYIRVAIKNRENNKRLIEIFNELECM
ncbi:aminotransferase class I/II-fold pyridoxal phosphate-dependent enzyme [Tissierella carlieri]|uniref:Aminotransferase class I/II-fold pyridoxal phosphate-dependent enzyme n=1 Tax=Tissierella carlieri TaxID=689904 RepID=A0ABT1S910_9FIRM|nr:histidinol-phosphate transaminase [Tissierella carlieri]MBU5312430.1 aminotransferase class I/II-fold pyridoxal phosphate-dependent enzyme [Tissierella carlieri]MCQ4922837.1 aminotransferase class I/II-fold pyridoxal phosphate-dependent enzyme [Tissierella carlieri]MDU5081046.1 histidinol-phosphate transaminase [Bacillota bacterium]